MLVTEIVKTRFYGRQSIKRLKEEAVVSRQIGDETACACVYHFALHAMC
jgi:hypothetical protein